MAGGATTALYESDKVKVPERWWRCIETQGEYVERQVLLFEKKLWLNFLLRNLVSIRTAS
jgi:hypothetical protein